MFTNTLSPNTLRSLTYLGKSGWLESAYLAGGTALALQLGHRISNDLDFFTQQQFNEQVLVQQLKSSDELDNEKVEWQTVLGEFMNTKLSIFFYEYNLIESTTLYEGIHLASLADIAAMKLHALEGRGARRDFIDLYLLAKTYTVPQIFQFYDQKYHCLADHKYQILKSLCYFEDAEFQDMPVMLIDINWEEIKDYFSTQSMILAKEIG